LVRQFVKIPKEFFSGDYPCSRLITVAGIDELSDERPVTTGFSTLLELFPYLPQ